MTHVAHPAAALRRPSRTSGPSRSSSSCRLFRYVRVRLSRKLWGTYRITLRHIVSSTLGWMLIAIGLGSGLPAGAAPVGGQIVSGQAQISASTSHSTLVRQTSQKAVINWQSFDIAANEIVRFVQPSASSVVLNRIVGNDASRIFGALTANGQVFLVNPQGVYFAPGARVDTGALVASTLALSNADFSAGRYTFGAVGSPGDIRNDASISVALGGYVVLAGPQVANSGSIIGNGGTVALLAGERISLDITGDRLVSYSVDAGALRANIANVGRIQADGGAVGLIANAVGATLATAVNHSGVIRANSVIERRGVITLRAIGGDTVVSGVIEATGASQRGGSMQVLGNRVALLDRATLNASGAAGGGTVLVGGAAHGKGGVPTSSQTVVGANTRISASATGSGWSGDGGTVIVWSDGHTAFNGVIEARGAGVGNGGFVETSGKSTLAFNGTVDTRAPHGVTGTLLLDPTDITISADPSSAGMHSSSGVFRDTTSASSTSNLNTTALQDALASTAVTVDTTSDLSAVGSITVNAAVAWASANRLTLKASGPIALNAAVSNSGSGGLTLATADAVTLNASMVLAGGGFNVVGADAVAGTRAASFSAAPGATISTAGGAVSIATVGSLATQAINTVVAAGMGAGSGAPVTLQGAGVTVGAGQTINAGDALIAIDAGGAALHLNDSTLTTTSNAVAAITLRHAADMVLGNLNTGAMGGLTLGVNADITGATTQTAGTLLRAGTLSASTAGATLLDGANRIDQLGAVTTTGTFTLANQGALTVTGDLAATGAVRISSVGGALALGSHSVTATGPDGNVSLTAVGVSQTTGRISAGGSTSIDGGSGSIELLSPSNAFSGAVTLTSSGAGVAVRAVNDLTLAAPTLGTNTGLVAIAGGTLTLPGVAIHTGSGSLELHSDAGTLATQGALTTTSGAITLVGAQGLRVDHALTTTSGPVALTGGSGGNGTGTGTGTGTGGVAISDAVRVDAGNSTISLHGGGAALALNHSTLTTTNASQSAITLRDASSVVLGNVSTGANGTLTLGAANDVGAVTQTTGTALHTGTLTASTTGAVTLDQLNQLAGLGAVATTGAFTLNNASATGLVVNGAVTTNGAAVSLTNTGGDLTLGSGASLAGAAVALTTVASGNLTLGGPVSAAGIAGTTGIAVTLTSAQNISQTAAGTLTTTGALLLNAGAAITLTANNSIAELGAVTRGGAFTLNNTGGGLTLTGSVDTGITSNSVSIKTAGGALALGSHAVTATGPDGNVSLTGLGVTQSTGSVTAGGSAIVNAGAGSIDLLSPSNDFIGAVTLTSSGANAAVRSAHALALAAPTLGLNTGLTVVAHGSLTMAAFALSTGTGAIELRSEAGVLATPGELSTSSGAITLEGAHGLNLAHNLTSISGAIALTGGGSGGLVLNPGRSVDAGNATIRVDGGGGAIALSDSTLMTTNATAAALTIRDASGVVLGTLSTGAAGTTRLGVGTDISGAVTQSAGAVLRTGTLTASTAGAITLDQTNQIASLGAVRTGGAFTLIDSLSGGLNVIGAVTTNGTGPVSLTNGGGDLSVASSGSVAGSAVALTTTSSGSIALGGTVNANSGGVTLTAAQNISQTSSGTLLTSGALALMAGGTVRLDQANAVGALAQATSNGALSFNNTGGALAVTGAVTTQNMGVASLTNAGGDLTIGRSGSVAGAGVTLGTSAGNSIALGGAVNGNAAAVTLQSGQNIGQSDAGTLNTTGALLLSAAGTITLDQRNTIGALGAVTRGGAFTLNDVSGGLTLTGSVSGGATANAVRITTTGALALGAFDVIATTAGGQVTLSGLGVTQSTGSITAGGTTTVNAGAGSIGLQSTANRFSGAVNTSGANIALTGGGTGLQLGATTATGTLDVTATAGAVTGTGALTVAGRTRVTSVVDAVALTNPDNDLAGGVLATAATDLAVVARNSLTVALAAGGNASVTALAGNLAVSGRSAAGLTTSSGAATLFDAAGIAATSLTSTAGGDVSQVGALSVGGAARITSSGGAITLANTGNAFGATLSATSAPGKDIVVVGSTDLTVGLSAGGNASVSALRGSLGVFGSTGAALTTSSVGATRFGAPDGRGSSSVGAALNTTSGGDVLQSAALTVAGATHFTSTTGSIALGNAGNDFASPVIAVATAPGGAIAVTGRRDLNIALTAGGAANVTALAGRLDVSGSTGAGLTTASGAVTSFGVTRVATTLNASAGADLLQGGALSVGGATRLASTGGNVTLTLDANEFTQLVTVSAARDAAVVDRNDLRVVLTAGGDAVVTTPGKLAVVSGQTGAALTTLSGAATVLGAVRVGTSLSVTAGSDVSQSDAVAVATTSAITATAGSVVLTNAANRFVGEVDFNGAALTFQTSQNAVVRIKGVTGNASITTGGSDITLNGGYYNGPTLKLKSLSAPASTGVVLRKEADRPYFQLGEGMASVSTMLASRQDLVAFFNGAYPKLLIDGVPYASLAQFRLLAGSATAASLAEQEARERERSAGVGRLKEAIRLNTVTYEEIVAPLAYPVFEIKKVACRDVQLGGDVKCDETEKLRRGD